MVPKLFIICPKKEAGDFKGDDSFQTTDILPAFAVASVTVNWTLKMTIYSILRVQTGTNTVGMDWY